MAYRRRLPLTAVAAAALLAGCGHGPSHAAAPTATTPRAAASVRGCAPTPTPRLAARHEPKPTGTLPAGGTTDVTFKTNCGTFVVRLDTRDSPHITAAFAYLVRRHYFDGTIFHRIVPGFVIQGGDPTGTGEGGPGWTVVDRPPSSTRYVAGVVAMAKSQAQPAGASGSQFFVVTGNGAASLPPDYGVLGRVVRGMVVVRQIGRLGDVTTEQPTARVEIERATVATR